MSYVRRKKIIYVDESLVIGGAEVYLKTLLDGFGTTFDLYLVHRDDRPHRDFYHGVDAIKMTLPINAYDSSLRLLASYCRILRVVSADVLHVNLPAPNYGYAATFAAYLCGVRNVVTTNHLPTLTFPRSVLGVLAGRSLWDWLVLRVVNTIVTTSIVVSTASAASLKANYPIDPEKIRCIHNGIDTERFAGVSADTVTALRREFGVGADDLLVTSVGRLHRQKGYEFLLQSVQTLIKQNINCTLLLVGDGPLQGELLQMVHDLGLMDRVVLAGQRNDIPVILAATDIYVNSSLFEGLPFSILEAMAAGLPVIATAVDGNRELLQYGRTGILVEAGDSSSLAAALKSLAASRELRHDLGIAGQNLVRELFTTERMLESTGLLYGSGVVCSAGGCAI